MNRQERRSHRKEFRQFYTLLDQWGNLPEAERRSDRGTALMARMLAVAPPEISDQLLTKAQEMGLFPPARYRDAQGNPMYTEYDLADHFGMDVADVRAHAAAYMDEFGETEHMRHADLSDLTPVH